MMKPKTQRKVNIRWEHVRPTLCTCCDKPSLYRIYVKTEDVKYGARTIHLCEHHFQELQKPVETETEIVIPTLVKISQTTIPANYIGVKSPLGNVIRDTDPGAMSDDEWFEHQKGKHTRKGGSRNGAVELGPVDTDKMVTSDILDMFS